jgi:hypothetical protein
LLHRHDPASSLLRAPPPPSRLRLTSQRAGYRADLPPGISPWDEEGFSSCVVCPCSRAVALTPPEWPGVSALVRLSMPSSSYGQGLDLRGFILSRLPLRSLALRPGNSLTILYDGFVDGLQRLGFSPRCHPSYRAQALTLVGLLPTEQSRLTWTHVRTPPFPIPQTASEQLEEFRHHPPHKSLATPSELFQQAAFRRDTTCGIALARCQWS